MVLAVRGNLLRYPFQSSEPSGVRWDAEQEYLGFRKMQDLLPANSDDNRFYYLPASGAAPCDDILWSGVAVQFPSQTSV